MSDTTRITRFPTKGSKLAIDLKGNPLSPESAQLIITFPGGSVEVTRLSDGDYWAHLAVNHGQADPEIEGFDNRRGYLVDSRVDRDRGAADPGMVEELADPGRINHVALRIRTVPGAARNI